MSQITQLGEAELDAYAKVQRRAGGVEYFHLVDGVNVPITAAEYAAATGEAI